MHHSVHACAYLCESVWVHIFPSLDLHTGCLVDGRLGGNSGAGKEQSVGMVGIMISFWGLVVTSNSPGLLSRTTAVCLQGESLQVVLFYSSLQVLECPLILRLKGTL